ncbi:MAG: hemerythrin domain-containing protein [Methanomassiliicoccus sp.]|nr:hemerythrin domain-containing protein [Methanomassiliicoccus sp.]
MKIVITLLSYDHGILRQVLDVVSDMAAEASFDRYRDFLPEMSDFFLTFMDRYHHGKEERFVFPLSAGGTEELKAMMPDLYEDHREAKAFALAIADNIAAWDTEALAKNCIGLAAHMRHHIREEEEEVFPAFEGLLDGDKDLETFEISQTFVKENFGEDFPSRAEDFARRLQDRVWGEGVIKYQSIKN